MKLTVACLGPLALLTAPAASAGGDVFVVDAAGGGDHLDLQPAIDAAADLDTILVKPGKYDGFTLTDKSLAIAADGLQPPRIRGAATIEDLAGSRAVSFSGLHFRDGFLVTDSEGSVLFADCIFTEKGLGDEFCGWESDGRHTVVASDEVVFSNCVLRGRDGDSQQFCIEVWDSSPGEPGMRIVDSAVSLYGCAVQGGKAGATASGVCGVFCTTPPWYSQGGDGIVAEATSFLYLDDTFPVGGEMGDMWQDNCSFGNQSLPGLDLDVAPESTLATASHALLSFGASSVAREGDALTLDVQGPAGAKGYAIWSLDPGWRYLGPAVGILHVKSSGLNLVFLGEIPPSGLLQADMDLPNLPPGDEGLRMYVQVLAAEGGQRMLGNVRRVSVVDASF